MSTDKYRLQGKNRFASSISYYRTCREYGARMQLLIADLWGADGTAQIAMPGDDGDWSSYDEFLNTLTQSVYENNMSEFLDLDIWNEPDLPDLFWQRNQSQYLQMWGRGYYRLREAFPFNNLVGPSSSSSPRLGNTWMEAFLEFIKANASVPDMYSWHLERSGDDLQITLPEFRTLRQDYQLPDRPITCNEYATEAEQQPAGSAWYISRLERYGIQGLRGNWAPNGSYDYFAGLLGKPHAETAEYNASQAGYWNNGEYNVYKYYKMNMTGTKVNTSGSADRLFDVYATMSDRNGNGPAVKMICGPRLANGTWDILVTGLNRAGLPPSGSIAIRTIEFDFQGGALGDVPFPTDLGIHRQSYRDNELTITVETVATRAFAFELLGPQS